MGACKMSNLSDLIKSIYEAAGKATKTPWKYYVRGINHGIIHSGKESGHEFLSEQVAFIDPLDGPFIVLSANNIEKLAQAVEIMMGALEKTISQQTNEDILIKANCYAQPAFQMRSGKQIRNSFAAGARSFLGNNSAKEALEQVEKLFTAEETRGER